MVHPMTTRIAVLGNEGVFTYFLPAVITQRWQACRTAAGSLDKYYRKARERQTEIGRFAYCTSFRHS